VAFHARGLELPVGDTLPFELDAMGRNHPSSDCCTRLAWLALPRKDDLPGAGNFNEQVNSVEQGARHFIPVAADLLGAADTVFAAVAMKAAGAGLRCLFAICACIA
jgi:hypothetical protein